MQSPEDQRAYDALVIRMSSVQSSRVRCGTCGETVFVTQVDAHADGHVTAVAKEASA